MDKELERLIYIYKRGLIMLSKVTEKDVMEAKKYLNCSYEEYVQGVAKKHLEIGKRIEEDKLSHLFKDDEEIDLDELFKEFEE